MKKHFFSLVFLCIYIYPVNATVITSITSSDLTVFDSDLDTIMDSSLSITDGFIRVFGSGITGRGVWEYDLSAVTSGASINSINVLFEDRGKTEPGDVFLYGFEGDGNASIADSNLTDNPIGSFTFGSETSDVDYHIALDNIFFQRLIDADASYAGILMISSDETRIGPGADICSFDSTFESCINTTGSTLTIDFEPPPSEIPVPATIWLLSSALFTLLGLRK